MYSKVWVGYLKIKEENKEMPKMDLLYRQEIIL